MARKDIAMEQTFSTSREEHLKNMTDKRRKLWLEHVTQDRVNQLTYLKELDGVSFKEAIEEFKRGAVTMDEAAQHEYVGRIEEIIHRAQEALKFIKK